VCEKVPRPLPPFFKKQTKKRRAKTNKIQRGGGKNRERERRRDIARERERERRMI